MTLQQIPLTNDPNQSFSCLLFTDNSNIQFDFTIWWNRIAGYWSMTIAQAGAELITGIPLLPALGEYVDIIGQWAYLAIGSFFVVPVSPSAPVSPGETDWGSNFALLWSP